jgi:hypothetical protein
MYGTVALWLPAAHESGNNVKWQFCSAPQLACATRQAVVQSSACRVLIRVICNVFQGQGAMPPLINGRTWWYLSKYAAAISRRFQSDFIVATLPTHGQFSTALSAGVKQMLQCSG